jgi:NAD(P)-dependent dehydrogenase (short-subunit alcohol dehydrogenase family)
MKALITGSNRGIGLELTRQLLEGGWRVFATCRNPISASKLNELGADYRNQISIIQLDVSDLASIESSFETISEQTDELDLLINNAGIQLSNDQISTLKIDEMVQTFIVNSIVPMLLCQRYLELLQAGELPRIVNISSLRGSLVWYEDSRFYSYSASKAALNMMTKRLSFETKAYGIITIVIHPGWVKTDMGGPAAKITLEESVSGMLYVIDNLTMKDNGKFLGWDGKEAPW